MKHIDYKIPGGKMIRLDVELEEELIRCIRITGDFFVHPETAIVDLENFLLERKVTEKLVGDVEEFLEKHGIRMIGITARHLVESLLKAL
ncbi:MAG: hypothetical protein ABIH90_01020 [Candidatus Aenigmatarchaeota archaeon]